MNAQVILNLAFTILFLVSCFLLGWISRIYYERHKAKKIFNLECKKEVIEHAKQT